MVSMSLFNESCRIYLTGLRKAIGRLGSLPDYPPRPALYPISVRQNPFLLLASFRFRVAADTLVIR